MDPVSDDLDALRLQIEEARAKLASLLQPPDDLAAAPLPPQLTLAGSLAGIPRTPAYSPKTAIEHARLWRTTGWSVWEIELSHGMRAATEGRKRKGLAVRIETFWRGRFYEPFYVVFALPALPFGGLATKEQIAIAAKPRGSSQAGATERTASLERLAIVHHTIPHWIKIPTLEAKYLLKPDGDVELFLARLTALLQAFISRREQLSALALSFSSTSNANPSHDSDEQCTRVQVSWQISDLNGKRRTVVVDAEADLEGEIWRGKIHVVETPLLTEDPQAVSTTWSRQRALENRYFWSRSPHAPSQWASGEIVGLDHAVGQLIKATSVSGWPHDH